MTVSSKKCKVARKLFVDPLAKVLIKMHFENDSELYSLNLFHSFFFFNFFMRLKLYVLVFPGSLNDVKIKAQQSSVFPGFKTQCL